MTADASATLSYLLLFKLGFVLFARQIAVNQLLKISTAKVRLPRHHTKEAIADVAAARLVADARANCGLATFHGFVNENDVVPVSILKNPFVVRAEITCLTLRGIWCLLKGFEKTAL
jgi:hypothetical protein